MNRQRLKQWNRIQLNIARDTQSLDAQAQIDPVNQVKVTADEVNKIMQAANISQPDADKLLAASRGEFVAGISDPNDPKWVKGIETRDSVNQNQQESEQNDQKAEQNSPNALQNEPETKQPEPVAQQEVEKSLQCLRSVWRGITALTVVR